MSMNSGTTLANKMWIEYITYLYVCVVKDADMKNETYGHLTNSPCANCQLNGEFKLTLLGSYVCTSGSDTIQCVPRHWPHHTSLILSYGSP